MYNWRKGIASWTVKDTTYLSIVFTWHLPEARKLCEASKKKIVVGGPAVKLMPDYLADVAHVEPETIYPALAFHNPLATFTSRGCINACPFCAVPRIEGKFRYVDYTPAPVVCDNNILASSDSRFHQVIDSLLQFPYVDFNQGLDARLFSNFHAEQLKRLKSVKVRFSLDNEGMIFNVERAIEKAKVYGLKDLGVYVLIGYKDTPQDAKHRLELVRSWGVRPNPMRYQPLDCLRKDTYIEQGWTQIQLEDMQRYYSKLRWLEHIPFNDYKGFKDQRQGMML
jgi:hypothetical protein